jgi:nucleotide-binding universal stress UspA family protein
VTTTVQRPYRILAAIDDSDMAHAVVERALDAAGRHAPSEVHFLRVVPLGRESLRGNEGAVDAAHGEIEEIVKSKVEIFGNAADQSGWGVRVHVAAGLPTEEILEMAADVEADVIIIGRFGSHDHRRDRIGTIPAAVLAGASCPVLVEQTTDYGLHERPDDACYTCVETRRTSNGERWFCDDHARGSQFRSTTLITSAYIPTHGGR